MPIVYLYIPFMEEEDNSDLQFRAIKWLQIERARPSPKNIKIILHKESRFDAKANEEIQKGAPVYILCHGVSDELEMKYQMSYVVCNTSQPGDPVSFINAEMLAFRIEQDGLLAKSNAKLKIFCCNSSGKEKAINLASEFIKRLSSDFHKSHTTVDCYDAIVTGPDDKLVGPHKGAYKIESPNFFDSKNALEVLIPKDKSRASENRLRLSANRSLILAKPALPIDSEREPTKISHKRKLT